MSVIYDQDLVVATIQSIGYTLEITRYPRGTDICVVWSVSPAGPKKPELLCQDTWIGCMEYAARRVENEIIANS